MSGVHGDRRLLEDDLLFKRRMAQVRVDKGGRIRCYTMNRSQAIAMPVIVSKV